MGRHHGEEGPETEGSAEAQALRAAQNRSHRGRRGIRPKHLFPACEPRQLLPAWKSQWLLPAWKPSVTTPDRLAPLEIDDQRVVVPGSCRAALYDFSTAILYPLPDRSLYDHLSRAGHPAPHIESPSGAELRHAWLEVTARCGCRCPHCYAEAGLRSPGDLPTSFWRSAIEQIRGCGASSIQITGGDATLREDLPDIVEAGANQGLSVELFSNLGTLSTRLVDSLGRHDAVVATTLFSDDATEHDRLTGSSGSWETTHTHREILRARGIPVRVVRPLLANDGIHDSSQARQCPTGCQPHKPDLEAPVWPLGRGASLSLPAPEEWPAWASSPSGIAVSREYFAFARASSRCFPGNVAVKADGSVLPCVFFRGRVLGNLTTQPLKEILTTPEYADLTALTVERIQGCRDCEFRYACLDAHCRAMPVAWGARVDVSPPSCRYDPHAGSWRGSSFSGPSIGEKHESAGGRGRRMPSHSRPPGRSRPRAQQYGAPDSAMAADGNDP